MYARYTVQLRDIMVNESSKPALEKALSTYPLYSNEKTYDLIPSREQLNTKLLNHYKYREIGFETVGRFLDELQITMEEIMPRYNELFKTVVTMAELPSPFDNVDVIERTTETRTHSGVSSSEQSASSTSESSGTASETSSGTASQTANGKHIESDTPQDSLSVGTTGINQVDYASKAQWNEDKLQNDSSGESTRSTTENGTGTSTASGTGTSESTDTVEHTYTKTGNQGVNTYAHDMNEFRTSIIDVVEQIINDNRVAELFMMVY